MTDDPPVHRVLRRQLARAGASVDAPPSPEAWAAFLALVERTYDEADAAQGRVEASFRAASDDMAALHAALAGERDRLSAVLAAIPAAVLEVGADGTVRWQNPAAVAFTGPDAVGRPLAGLLELRDAGGRAIPAARLGAREAPWFEPEGRVTSVTGAVHEAAFTVSPLPGGGAVVTVADQTAERRTERALTAARVDAEVARRAERTRGQFLANMSHELRTPLNAIIGYTELLVEEHEGDPRTRGDLERVLASGQHLLALINDVLDLTKVDAGQLQLHLEEIDLRALVEEVAASITPLAARSGVRVETRFDDGLAPIRSDGARVRQCLVNLADNAAKFTQRGVIRLAVAREGVTVAVRVEDTGIGISTEAQSRLFQPFTQVDASATRAHGGTGLGLALTKAFAEMLGGSVAVQSTPGEGSTFTLRLPVAARPDDAPAPLPTERWSSGDGPATVLVVDDDPSIFDLVARMLALDGVRVVGVPTAEAALVAVREERPAVVLLDIQLPGVNGWVALRALRDDPRTADVKVVVSTTGDDGRRTAERLGADGFAPKPLDRAALLRQLRALLPGTPMPAPRRSEG